MIYWKRVLILFEKNGYFENGLTIPFLIGSKVFVEPGSETETIRDFFTSLYGGDSKTTIMRCGRIHEFVIGVLDSETKKMMSQYPNLYKEFGQILVTDGSLDHVKHFDDLVLEMERIYNSVIQCKLFSKENGKWREYNQEEIIRIRECVN